MAVALFQMSYAVVKFVDEDEVLSEVPSSRLSKDKKHCKSPKDKFAALYITKCLPPQENWSEHPVIVKCFCGMNTFFNINMFVFKFILFRHTS